MNEPIKDGLVIPFHRSEQWQHRQRCVYAPLLNNVNAASVRLANHEETATR